MQLISESDTELVFRQAKSYFGKVTGVFCLALAISFLDMIAVSPDFYNVVMYVFLAVAVGLGILGIVLFRQKMNPIMVTMDKNRGTVTCQADPGDVLNIGVAKYFAKNIPEVAFADIALISDRTSPFGLILKDGTIVQYGDGRSRNESRYFQGVIARFLNVPIGFMDSAGTIVTQSEMNVGGLPIVIPSYVNRMYGGDQKKMARGVVISIIIVIVAFVLLTRYG